MEKNSYVHFRLSNEELKKMDIVCEYYECNRSDLLRRFIELAYVKMQRKVKKAK